MWLRRSCYQDISVRASGYFKRELEDKCEGCKGARIAVEVSRIETIAWSEVKFTSYRLKNSSKQRTLDLNLRKSEISSAGQNSIQQMDIRIPSEKSQGYLTTLIRTSALIIRLKMSFKVPFCRPSWRRKWWVFDQIRPLAWWHRSWEGEWDYASSRSLYSRAEPYYLQINMHIYIYYSMVLIKMNRELAFRFNLTD